MQSIRGLVVLNKFTTDLRTAERVSLTAGAVRRRVRMQIVCVSEAAQAQ